MTQDPNDYLESHSFKKEEEPIYNDKGEIIGYRVSSSTHLKIHKDYVDILLSEEGKKGLTQSPGES